MSKLTDIKVNDRVVVYVPEPGSGNSNKPRACHKETVARVTKTQFITHEGARFFQRNGRLVGTAGEWWAVYAEPWSTKGEEAIEAWKTYRQRVLSQHWIEKRLPDVEDQSVLTQISNLIRDHLLEKGKAV